MVLEDAISHARIPMLEDGSSHMPSYVLDKIVRGEDYTPMDCFVDASVKSWIVFVGFWAHV